MIVVVDYGVGNLSSVANMLRKAGADVCISNEPSEIRRAEKLLLPGVGHFDYGMKMLNRSGLRDAIEEFALHMARPVLGICLGAQMLGKGSEEGDTPGLGWIDMESRKLSAQQGIRVPHMGWAHIVKPQSSPLLDDIIEDARFYFVHSYFMSCNSQKNVIATTKHGVEFASAVQEGQIFGTQFHPEKSLSYGLAVMKAFAGLTTR